MNEFRNSSGKDFIFGEQTLLRLACKTLSKMDDVSWPRIEICLWGLFFRPRIGDKIEQWHG